MFGKAIDITFILTTKWELVPDFLFQTLGRTNEMTQTQVTKSKLSVFSKFKSHKKYFLDNFGVKEVEVDVFNLLMLRGQHG